MNFTISPWKNLGWITVFAIAMGFLETAVVVYLRVLLYPGGFSFPLAIMPHSLAIIEIYREAATLVMLIGIGYLSGKNGTTRFAFFLYAFAVWDLFYYVFLKIFIHWPESWMTWDILFLIPTNWVGPVVAPIVVSLTMIICAWVILYFDAKHGYVIISWKEWTLLIVGSLLLIITFIWDYSSYVLDRYSLTAIWSIPADELLNLVKKYVPRKFNWSLFALAELTIISGIVVFWRRNGKQIHK